MAQVNAILAVISLAAIQLSCGTGVKSGSMAGKENPQVRAVDHMVPHVSTVPANKGEKVQLFVREKFAGDAKNKPVVLMVHGGFSPSTLAFDVEREDYSWMSYLASAGFDVFAMDMTVTADLPARRWIILAMSGRRNRKHSYQKHCQSRANPPIPMNS